MRLYNNLAETTDILMTPFRVPVMTLRGRGRGGPHTLRLSDLG